VPHSAWEIFCESTDRDFVCRMAQHHPPPPPQWVRSASLSRLHGGTHTTLGRTPLDEWPTHRRNFYLTPHNTPQRPTSMPPAGFEPAALAREWPQTHTIDSASTGMACYWIRRFIIVFTKVRHWYTSLRIQSTSLYLFKFSPSGFFLSGFQTRILWFLSFWFSD